MKVKEIYCTRIWLLNRKWFGITLYPFIFYNRKYWYIREDMRRHEWVHVEQVRKEGWFKFYLNYLKQNFIVGYKNNPYELEAYAKQNDGKKPWETEYD